MTPVRLPGRGRHKFNAQACVIDGIRFASQKEGRRYRELKLLEKAGDISALTLQPAYVLYAQNGLQGVSLGVYRGDFSYYDRRGNVIVEDVKGFKTPLYRWKKKHVEAQYGITITEI